MSSLEEEWFPAICQEEENGTFEKENRDPLSDTGPPDENGKDIDENQKQNIQFQFHDLAMRYDDEAATEKQSEHYANFQDAGNHDFLSGFRPPCTAHPDEFSEDIDESQKQNIEFQDHNLVIQEDTTRFDERARAGAEWKQDKIVASFHDAAKNIGSDQVTSSNDDVDSNKWGGESSDDQMYYQNQSDTVCEESQLTLSPEINDLLKTQDISPLAVPLHYGFERIIREFVDVGGTSSSECCYQVKNDVGIVELNNLEAVSNYLLKARLDIPISMFSFETVVRTSLIIRSDHRESNVIMADISEGQERIRIPVICPKKGPRGPLSTYVKEYVTDEKNVPLEHDGEFLACCDCRNDCKDKLNCACFLRTLDNCSEKTRKINGDLNIGYQYKRLAKPILSGIFECNKRCKCKNTCFNRVAQNGILCRLQIFKTLRKGWGVRTLHDIPKGVHICNYVGKIVSQSYADKVSTDLNNGRWKYLTMLSVGEVDKEGYEADVIHPELPPLLVPFNEIEVRDSDQINHHEEIECPKLGLSIPELYSIEDIPQHQDGRDDDENENNYVLESCDSKAIECDKGEEITLRHETFEEIDSSSSNSPHSTTTLIQMSPLKRDNSRSSSRLLRSGASEDHSFVGNLSPCKEKRFGDNLNISLEDHKAIILLNKISERRAHCKLVRGRRKGKATKFRFVEECYVYNRVSRNGTSHENGIDRMKKSSRIVRSVVEKIAGGMKFDSSVFSPSRRRFTVRSNWRAYHTSIRSMVNIKPRRKFVNRYRKDLPAWQKPSLSCSTAKKRTSSSFTTMSYGKRRRVQCRMNKKRNAAQATQHSLLNFGLNVDGIDTGNVGRYFNHSCDPNLFPQYVFVDCHDLRLPQIAFFALRNIQAGEELTWNYNYEREGEQDISAGSNGRNYAKKIVTRLPCYCGKDNCSKRLW